LAIASVPAAQAKAAAHYRSAIEKDVAPIHKIVSQSERTKRAVADGRTAIESVRGSLEAIGRTTRDKTHVDAIIKAMTTCFADALKAGTESADSIKTHLELAESVLGAVVAPAPASAPAAPPPAAPAKK